VEEEINMAGVEKCIGCTMRRRAVEMDRHGGIVQAVGYHNHDF